MVPTVSWGQKQGPEPPKQPEFTLRESVQLQSPIRRQTTSQYKRTKQLCLTAAVNKTNYGSFNSVISRPPLAKQSIVSEEKSRINKVRSRRPTQEHINNPGQGDMKQFEISGLDTPFQKISLTVTKPPARKRHHQQAKSFVTPGSALIPIYERVLAAKKQNNLNSRESLNCKSASLGQSSFSENKLSKKI